MKKNGRIIFIHVMSSQRYTTPMKIKSMPDFTSNFSIHDFKVIFLCTSGSEPALKQSMWSSITRGGLE